MGMKHGYVFLQIRLRRCTSDEAGQGDQTWLLMLFSDRPHGLLPSPAAHHQDVSYIDKYVISPVQFGKGEQQGRMSRDSHCSKIPKQFQNSRPLMVACWADGVGMGWRRDGMGPHNLLYIWELWNGKGTQVLPPSPFQSSKTVHLQHQHVEHTVQGWPNTLIHMHGCKS